MQPLIAKLRALLCDRERLLLTIVAMAALGSVVYYSKERATDTANYAILVAIGVAAVGYCVIGSTNATHAWFQRRPLRCALWTSVVAVAMLWEANAHLGVGSANQDALSATRVASFEQRVDRKGEVNRIAGNLNDLKREAAWQYTGDPIDASQSKIEAAHAHKFYRVNTQGCTIVKGPETTKFCNDLKQLEANKAMAARKLLLAEEIKAAEAGLAQARAAAEKAPVTASAERADTRNIKKVALGLFGIENYDADFGNAALLVLAMLAFMSLTEVLRTAREYDRADVPSWGVVRLARKLWHFAKTLEWAEPPHVAGKSVVLHTRETVITDEALKRWAQSGEVKLLKAA